MILLGKFLLSEPQLEVSHTLPYPALTIVTSKPVRGWVASLCQATPASCCGAVNAEFALTDCESHVFK